MTHRADPPPDRLDVSVVVPCYQAAGFLADALDSVLAQRPLPREVLVVDDGSPDGAALAAVVRRYGDAPIPVRLIKEPHRGLAATRNAGIAAAGGEWVAFLDADDCWLPDFLAPQMALLRDRQADLAYCDALFFGGSDKDGGTVMTWFPSEEPVTLEALLAGTCVPVMSTIVARREAVRRVGGFDVDVAFGEDFELWVRMAADGARFAFSRDVRARRRIHADNMSHDTVNMSRGQTAVIERHASRMDPDHPLADAVRKRLRRLEREIHLARARQALASGDRKAARRALWHAWRHGGSAKHAVGAVALTVAPKAAARFLQERMR